MASYNPNISNGTCYYAENTKTKGDFFPCGNDAITTWPCCFAGSFCLGLGDSNSCWDPTSGNTYVAGCTDPSFISPECIHKPAPFHDQEWVAINQACKNLNDGSEEITNWTGCEVADDSTNLFKLPMASCTAYCSSSDIVYAGSSSLAAYASLPTLSGSSIFWQNNYAPPTTPAAGYTPGTPTGVAGTSAPSASSPPEGTSGLSTGAKVGIGVGAGVGGILIVAALASFLVFYLRRRRKRQQQPHPNNSFHPAAGAPLYAPVGQSSPPPPAFSTPATYHHHSNSYNSTHSTGYPPDANAEYAPYTGYKAELPASQPGLHPGYPHGSPPLSSATTALGGSSPSTVAASRSYSHRVSPQGYTEGLAEGATLEPQYGTDNSGGGGYYYGLQPPPPSPGKDTNGTGPVSELHG